MILQVGGIRQSIIWHLIAVASLDPAMGKVLWQQPFSINMGMTLATLVLSGSPLLVSSFYYSSMFLDLVGAGVRFLWKGKSNSEIDTDGLHAVIITPVIDGIKSMAYAAMGDFVA